MRYRVTVPVATTERFRPHPVVVTVAESNGWQSQRPTRTTLPPVEEPVGFEFEVGGDSEWLHDPDRSTIDGWTFRVTATYANASGSRSETIDLRPEPAVK